METDWEQFTSETKKQLSTFPENAKHTLLDARARALAVNPVSGEKFHVEVRVTIERAFRLRLKDAQTRNGRKHRRGLDTLNAIKFSPPTVVKAIKEIFGSSEYRKVLVVWEVEDGSVIEQAKSFYAIEVWKMSDIMGELIREVKTKAYRDDVLRTIQLISMPARSLARTRTS